MDITVSTEQAVRTGMPVTHYVLGVIVGHLCNVPDGCCNIDSVSASLNMENQHAEDILRAYPEYFSICELSGCVYLEAEGIREFGIKKFKSIAQEVIDVWNRVNGERRTAEPYKKTIDSICKARKDITLESFESVIVHKRETWGEDESMREYNRPKTIFKSVNAFLVYLEDARVYWNRKYKRESF